MTRWGFGEQQVGFLNVPSLAWLPCALLRRTCMPPLLPLHLGTREHHTLLH